MIDRSSCSADGGAVNLGHLAVAVDADDLVVVVMVVRQGRVAEEGRRRPIEAVGGRYPDGQAETQDCGFESGQQVK